MKNKKLLTAAICIVMISLLVITGAAVTKYKFASSSGETVSQFINRVNLEVSATEFNFNRISKDGMLECRTVVSIEKSEADFYGVLHSITLSGADFGYIMYTAGKNNKDALLPDEVAITANDPLEWEIAFTVPYEQGKTTYDLTLDINYSTGVKPNLAQRYMTSIPVIITVEK